MKLRAPLLAGFQVDVIFGVEEAGGIGAIVGATHLRHHLRDFREAGEDQPRLVHDLPAGSRAGAGSESAACPNGALVKMGQKLGADHAAESQI